MTAQPVADDRHAERVAAFLNHACPDWQMGGGPYDEARASAIVDLFLAHGADPSMAMKDGMTAAALARRRRLDEVAAKLDRGVR